MTAAAILPATRSRLPDACAALARKAGLEALAVRIADATPVLIIFGPAAALLFLLTAPLADLRLASGA